MQTPFLLHGVSFVEDSVLCIFERSVYGCAIIPSFALTLSPLRTAIPRVPVDFHV